MDRLMVINDTTYNTTCTTSADIANLATNELVAFNEDGTLITPGVAPTGDYVTFATKLSTGEYVNVHKVHRGTFGYEYKAYAAPAARKIFYGADAAGASAYPVSMTFTPTAGGTYSIITRDKTRELADPKRNRNYWAIATTGETITALLSRLVAMINADSLRVANAALISSGGGVGCGISFTGFTTGSNAYHDFTVEACDDLYGKGKLVEIAVTGTATAGLIDGVYADASTTPTLATLYGAAALLGAPVVGTLGIGTVAKVKEAELEELVQQGANNHPSMFGTAMNSIVSQVTAGNTYDTYVLTWEGKDRNFSTRPDDSVKPKLTINAIVNAGLKTSITNLLNSF